MTENQGKRPSGELSEETPDVEGHSRHMVDPQAGEETPDVEGHARHGWVDPQADEDDVEGHKKNFH